MPACRSTQSGADWPAVPPGKLSSHLTPPHLNCEVVEDGSVLVLRIGVATVSVSWELAGTWYVGIEGSETPEWADSVTSEIAQQLAKATCAEAVYYRVTDSDASSF